MTDNNTSLMQFPCHFPIKVIGIKTANFVSDVTLITRKYFPNTRDEDITSQDSKQSNYISLTLTVYAENQTTLDALYLELTKHPDMKMVL